MSKKGKAALLGKPQRAFLRGLLLFVLFLGLNVLFENRDAIELESTSCDTVHADATPPFYERLYPWLTKYRLGESTSDRVRILFIPKDLVVVQQNLCKGRSYLGDLVTTLTVNARYRPSTIVLDKYFSRSACTGPGDIAATVVLQDAIAAAQRANINVIVGESTTPAPFRTEDHSCLQRNPDQMSFGSPENPTAISGLLKLNANREQIPLQWNVLAEEPKSRDAKGSPSESLAVVTAKTDNLHLEERPRFQSVMRGTRQPYARLRLEIPEASTQHLLCASGDERMQGTWNCPPHPPGTTPSVLDQNRRPFESQGKVVVVGSQNEVDHWTVLGQRRWGYQLQAAYIDALLSERYLRAASGTWIVAISILFVLFLEGVPALGEYLHCEKNWKVPRALREAEAWVWIYPPVFCVFALLCFVSLHYLPPLSVLFGVLVTWIARLLFNGMEHFQKLTVPHKQESES